MKKLLLDFDDVVCQSVFLDMANEFLGSNYVIDDFTNYYVDEEAIPKNRFEEFKEYMSNHNLYLNAKLMPHAKEVLERLNNVLDIYICSSCLSPFNLKDSGRIFKDKYDFILKELPFLDPHKFIFTGAKNLVTADFIIDDRLDNLKNNTKIKILFPAHHNHNMVKEELNGIVTFPYDLDNVWLLIEKFIMDNL